MRGTPYCYYGDELGMTNIGFDKIEEYKDIAAINGYKKVVNSGGDAALYLKNLKFGSRDNGRTPMQWDSTSGAGFTSGSPWLPVNKNSATVNVQSQEVDSNSVLNHFKKMIALRKMHPILVYGAYELLHADHPEIYAYTRTLDDDKVLIVLNFSAKRVQADFPGLSIGDELINNMDNAEVSSTLVTLQPYQAIVFSIK
jgi:oligo-1,6-glucosidase